MVRAMNPSRGTRGPSARHQREYIEEKTVYTQRLADLTTTLHRLQTLRDYCTRDLRPDAPFFDERFWLNLEPRRFRAMYDATQRIWYAVDACPAGDGTDNSSESEDARSPPPKRRATNTTLLVVDVEGTSNDAADEPPVLSPVKGLMPAATPDNTQTPDVDRKLPGDKQNTGPGSRAPSPSPDLAELIRATINDEVD